MLGKAMEGAVGKSFDSVEKLLDEALTNLREQKLLLKEVVFQLRKLNEKESNRPDKGLEGSKSDCIQSIIDTA
jgi:hypothetical protein